MAQREAPVLSANEAVVRATIDAINRHDVGALRKAWHPEIVAEMAAVGTFQGPGGVAGYFTELFAAVPDFRLDVLSLACEDDTVLVHWRATGTFTGRPFQGVRATGSGLDLKGFDCMTFDRGLLRHNCAVYDGALWARQVGLLPAAGSARERLLIALFNVRTRLVGRARDR